MGQTGETGSGEGDSRQRRMAALKARIKACRQCEGMNIPGVTQSAPGCGSVQSPVVIVGQSLCHKCMESQIPFTGGSGKLIEEARILAHIAKERIFITNVVHCHPHDDERDNRPSHPREIANCTPYLYRELDIVEPRLVIGLGRDARAVLQSRYPDTEPLPWPFAVPRAATPGPALLFGPHPSHVLMPWVRKKRPGIREEFVASLTQALTWSFSSG
jgi:uracil-DNA glycosylase